MANEDARDLSDANQKVLRDMINYAKRITRDEIPENAVRWIVQKLENASPMKEFHKNNASTSRIVQVDYNFSGQTVDGNKWEVQFTINADLPNPNRGHESHYGGEIALNKKNVLNTHKWLKNAVLPAGRPNDKNYAGMEEYLSGKEKETFSNGDSAEWICMSKKIGH